MKQSNFYCFARVRGNLQTSVHKFEIFSSLVISQLLPPASNKSLLTSRCTSESELKEPTTAYHGIAELTSKAKAER